MRPGIVLEVECSDGGDGGCRFAGPPTSRLRDTGTSRPKRMVKKLMRRGHRTLAGGRVVGFVAGGHETQLVAFTLKVVFAVIIRAELGYGPRQRVSHRTESTSIDILA